MPEMLMTPFEHPAAWTRAQMQGNPEWSYTLNPSQVAEVKAAVRHAIALGLPLLSLTAEDFPGDCAETPLPFVTGYVDKKRIFSDLADCVGQHLDGAALYGR